MSQLSKLALFSILSFTGSLAAYGNADLYLSKPRTTKRLTGQNQDQSSFFTAKPKKDQAYCEPHSYPERVTVRAIEGKGVGYNTGYTTLEGFFTVPSLMNTDWVPFLDLRGHVFNDGKTAANAGIGLRYVGSSQVWGINSYYDFRHTSHKDFNQYGLGLECLGRVFDFRINGYLPFGKKESRFYGAKFDRFKGNSLILSQKRDVAFKGAHGEVGYHAKITDDIKFYTAAGPYFIGHKSRNAWGGELRVAFDFTKYLRLEGNTSYDRIFRWIGQGQVSVNIPFGPRDKIQRKGSNCRKQLMLRDRSLQRVDRDEIIVTEKRRSHTTAIDPATGLPFFFIFVNNTSHSLGTFESPFPTLTQAEANSAPGNYILVSSGNGSAYTNQLITLKDNQKLWGTGLSYLLKTKEGSVTIPALSAFPTISTTAAIPAGSFAVKLGNNCEVAGLNISNFHSRAIGIGADDNSVIGITNTYIHDNILSNGANGGILLGNCQGNLEIFNNQLTNVLDAGFVVGGIALIDGGIPINCNLSVVGNTIINSQGDGILVFSDASSGTVELYIADNIVLNTNVGAGIEIVNEIALTGVGSSLCGTVINNISNNNSASGLLVNIQNNVSNQLNISGNTFIGNTNSGVNAFTGSIASPGPLCLSMKGNTATNSPTGYIFSNGNSTGKFEVENLNTFSNYNVGSVSTTGTITSVPAGTCTCD